MDYLIVYHQGIVTRARISDADLWWRPCQRSQRPGGKQWPGRSWFPRSSTWPCTSAPLCQTSCCSLPHLLTSTQYTHFKTCLSQVLKTSRLCLLVLPVHRRGCQSLKTCFVEQFCCAKHCQTKKRKNDNLLAVTKGKHGIALYLDSLWGIISWHVITSALFVLATMIPR